MSHNRLSDLQVTQLQGLFGDALRIDVPLAPFTSARIGGPADFLLEIESAEQLEEFVRALWEIEVPFKVLGGGSNVLVADEGVREVILLNKARRRRFVEDQGGLSVWAESGCMLGTLARLAAERGWSGLEWAAGVPGTLGGAVVGNAGAQGSDISQSLSMAEILQHAGSTENWNAQQLDFEYRSSRLKQEPGAYVVLNATLRLQPSTPEACKQKMRTFSDFREKTQPPGASMGSMFKNPPGDYAGRLIEQTGLKGSSQGNVQISNLHANFFVNLGDGRAADVWNLMEQARRKVFEQTGIKLEAEVELLGAWSLSNRNNRKGSEQIA